VSPVPATPERATVHEENGEVVIELPAGIAYAALALRIDTDNEQEAQDKLLAVADATAKVVEGDPAITVLQGPEAIAALDFAARRWAESLGLGYGKRRIQPDPIELADHMRRSSARASGIDTTALLMWGNLTEHEQRRWLVSAWAAIAYYEDA
jgi:hypothetical protein